MLLWLFVTSLQDCQMQNVLWKQPWFCCHWQVSFLLYSKLLCYNWNSRSFLIRQAFQTNREIDDKLTCYPQNPLKQQCHANNTKLIVYNTACTTTLLYCFYSVLLRCFKSVCFTVNSVKWLDGRLVDMIEHEKAD